MAGKRIDNAFLLMIYPREDETHKNALEMLRRGLISSTWEYYCVEHDKDKTDDGELKKPHTHVVLFTNRKMSKGTLANALQIAENYTSYSEILKTYVGGIKDSPLLKKDTSSDISNLLYIFFWSWNGPIF